MLKSEHSYGLRQLPSFVLLSMVAMSATKPFDFVAVVDFSLSSISDSTGDNQVSEKSTSKLDLEIINSTPLADYHHSHHCPPLSTQTMVLSLLALAVLTNVAAAATTPVTGYSNHTVGGDSGWFFNSTTNKTSTNYSSWAANQTFSLGDFLIFNTNTNSTVIQTYNQTTYNNCTVDNALDNDTFQYQGGSSEFGQPSVISVPLTIEGTQYYFSGADDGLQCENDMAFEIKVGHGLGLPPSLNHPPPPPYVEPPSTVEEGQTPPITIVTGPPSGGMRSAIHVHWVAALVILVLYLYLV